jgi:GTP cyclohydrolase I
VKWAADYDLRELDGEPGPPAVPAPRSASVPAVEEAVRHLLAALGFDPSAADLQDTPRRAAAALVELLTPAPVTMTTFANSEGYGGLVLARAVPFHAVCRHHLLPFIGVAHVAYVPGDRIVGLSKIVRTVHHFARDLQVQERLTVQIADCLERALRPRGVGVVLEAEHLCMSLRGVRTPGTRTFTSTLRGALEHDGQLRAEFLAVCGAGGHAEAAADAPAGARGEEVLVSRRESPNAAHRLYDPALSEDENRRIFGKCVNLHGHNYTVEVVVAGDAERAGGYVMDLKRLSDLVCREIIGHVDHWNLNTDVPWLAGRIPTAETLAAVFWARLVSHLPPGALRAVRVHESEKNWAEYRARDP